MIENTIELFKNTELWSTEEEEMCINCLVTNFLECPIGVDSRSSKPLLVAIRHGYPLVVKCLLQQGCILSPTDLDSQGKNSLEIAILNIHTNVLDILLTHIQSNKLTISLFDAKQMLIIQALSLPIQSFQRFAKVIIYIYIYIRVMELQIQIHLFVTWNH